LISLITFGFAVASKDCSLRLNSVFSSCFGAASSSSTGAATAAGAPPPPPEKPPIGISGMLSRDFNVATRSAVSRRVNWLIWSTMPEILVLAEPASEDCHLRWAVYAILGEDLMVDVEAMRLA